MNLRFILGFMGKYADKMIDVYKRQVWGMIRSNQVNSSISESCNNLLAVIFRTKRRIHLCQRAMFQNSVFC